MSIYPNIPQQAWGLDVAQAKVHSLALSYIPPMKHQVRRPLSVVATPDVLDNFIGTVVASKSRRYTKVPAYDQQGNPFREYSAKELTAHCNGLIGFSARSEDTAIIPGGWSSDRYSFDMVVEYVKYQGAKETIRIVGYSDRFYDSSYSGYMAPEMRFHVDHITVLANTSSGGLGLPPRHESVITTSVNCATTGYNVAYRLDESKVLAGIEQQGIMAELSDDNQIFDMDAPLSDATPGVGDNLESYSPSLYAAGILNAVALESKNLQSTSSHDVYRDAATEFAADAFSRNVLIMKLTELSCTRTKGIFTLEALCKLDPNAANLVSNVTSDIPSEIMQSCNDWGYTTLEEQCAWQLIQTVISCAYRNGIGSGEFEATNMGRDTLATHHIIPQYYHPFNPQINLTAAQMQSFGTQVCSEGLPQISGYGMFAYHVRVQFDVTRISQVEVAIDGCQPQSYLFPVFAGSCASPFITTDGAAYSNLVTSMYDVGEQIYGGRVNSELSIYALGTTRTPPQLGYLSNPHNTYDSDEKYTPLSNTGDNRGGHKQFVQSSSHGGIYDHGGIYGGPETGYAPRPELWTKPTAGQPLSGNYSADGGF